MADTCDHKYVYLRQDAVVLKSHNRRRSERSVRDVFFCEHCLTYQAREIRREAWSRPTAEWIPVNP